MKNWLMVVAVLMMGMLVGACASTSSGKAADAEKKVEERGEVAPIEAIALDSVVVSTEWLAEHVDYPQVVTVHVGNDREAWAAGHVPGQAFVPFGSIVVGSMETGFVLPDMGALRGVFEAAGVSDGKVVVLTGDMEGLMASRAFYSLEALGLAGSVAVLDGGLAQWIEEDRPVSHEAKEPVVGTITATPNMGMIVDADQVMEMLGNAAYQLVDARPPAEFSGETPGLAIVRGGHIPGAVNVFWKDTLVKKDRPLLMPVTEIEGVYQAAGVPEKATIVAYCRTGVQASFGYLLGRLQGRDVLIYDGSYIDWSADVERPIEKTE